MNLLSEQETAIAFTVYGKPAQQGSKSAMVRNGRAIMFEANAKSKAEWRQSVVMAGQAAMKDGGHLRLAGPVELRVTFFFRRPQSHYGSGKKAAVLKSSSPQQHVQTPDLDKLVRNIGDSLTGVVVNDDRQIYSLIARREWTEDSERAEILVREV